VSTYVQILMAADIWSIFANRTGDMRRSFASGSLLAVSLGWVTVSLLMREAVVTTWIAGRPIRRGRAGPARTAITGTDISVGKLWLHAAADEAAAVTAFFDLAVRLDRVGAPEALIKRSRAAATEEERHVRVCERIAVSLELHPAPGGEVSLPHPIAPAPEVVCGRHPARRPFGRSAELVRLAVESFLDGVVGEGFAAQRLFAGSETMADHHNRGLLRSIAREEKQHAALGEDIVAWAFNEHPLLVGAALSAAARRLPDGMELPAAYREFCGSELRNAGLVDAIRARKLWSLQRTAAVDWLGQLLQGSADSSASQPTRMAS